MSRAARAPWILAFVEACSSPSDPPASPPETPPQPLSWSVAAPCPVARFEANGVIVDGELWVMGGFVSSALEVTRRIDIYDPATDTWRQGPDLPGAETHVAAVTLARDIVVAGGFSGNFSFSSRLPTTDAVWRWSAASAEWSPGPSLPVAGAAFAWALLGSKLHLAGGLGPDGDTDATVHHVWDLAGPAAWTEAAPLPGGRNHGGGAATGGHFYAIAGRLRWDEAEGDLGEVDAFDPVTSTWSSRAPILGARSEIGASTATLTDGRVLVVGGSVPGVMPSDDVLAYDAAHDEWSKLPSLPEKRKGAVAAQFGKRLVVTTGSPASIDPSATTFVGCCL
jgi:N-acetylneuraminic acid mutarotase